MKRGPASDAPSSVTKDERAARGAAAQRLLEAARSYRPTTSVTLQDIQGTARARHGRGRQIPLRWAVAIGIPLLVLTSVGSVALSRGWTVRFWPTHQRPEVPKASATPPAKNEKTRRVHISLSGPAKLQVSGPSSSIALEEGQAQITSEESPTEIKAGPTTLSVAPGETLTLRPEGPGTWRAVPGGVVPPAIAPNTKVDGPSPLHPLPASGHAKRMTGRSSIAPRETALASALIELPASSMAGSPSALTAEMTLVREAITRLRVEHDGRGALALLDSYQRNFPEGDLARVAAILRIEALMASGRQREAWVRLEALPAEEVRQSTRLRVARAELRSLHGHCPEALADLTTLSSQTSTPDLDARASRVRQSCQENPAP